MVKRFLSLMFLLVIFFYAGCAGNEPEPIAVYRSGDESRCYELLSREIERNEAVITEKKAKDAEKFWTNLIWFVTFFPGMDIKEAEKKEAETLAHRNDYLKHLVAKRSCGDMVAVTPTAPMESVQKSRKFLGYKVIDWEPIPVYKDIDKEQPEYFILETAEKESQLH